VPPELEICAVRLPGREMRIREPLIDDLQSIVDSLAEALAQIPAKPYVLFGHSMGALLAYELACRLRDRQCEQPRRLIVSGSQAPQKRREPLSQPVDTLTDAEFLEEIATSIHPGIRRVTEDTELATLVVPILRADFQICQGYTHGPRPPLTMPIHVLHGSSDSSVTADDVKPWAHCTVGTVSMNTLPGDHFFVHNTETVIPAILNAVNGDPRDISTCALSLSASH